MNDSDFNIEKFDTNGQDIKAKILYLKLLNEINSEESLTYFTLLGILESLKHELLHEGNAL